MVKTVFAAAAFLIALCSSCEAFDWRFSEADLSPLKNTSDFLRVLGMPAEVAVIRERAAGRQLATSRWTYFFVLPSGIVPFHCDFAISQLVKRDSLPAPQARRYRLLSTDFPRNAATVFRYKRDHPQ